MPCTYCRCDSDHRSITACPIAAIDRATEIFNCNTDSQSNPRQASDWFKSPDGHEPSSIGWTFDLTSAYYDARQKRVIKMLYKFHKLCYPSLYLDDRINIENITILPYIIENTKNQTLWEVTLTPPAEIYRIRMRKLSAHIYNDRYLIATHEYCGQSGYDYYMNYTRHIFGYSSSRPHTNMETSRHITRELVSSIQDMNQPLDTANNSVELVIPTTPDGSPPNGSINIEYDYDTVSEYGDEDNVPSPVIDVMNENTNDINHTTITTNNENINPMDNTPNINDNIDTSAEHGNEEPDREKLIFHHSRLVDPVQCAYEAHECAICMESLGETNKAILRCGHQFCCDCIFKHFQTAMGSHCPSCRSEYAQQGINLQISNHILPT